MILDALQLTLDRNKEKSPLFLRNLLKEQLQQYVLNFVYNSSYAERFLFKGGTCLRYCFDLPRLSEDLDFDIDEYDRFSHEKFVDDIRGYFRKTLHFSDFDISVSGKNKLIYLAFPLLSKIGYPVNPHKPSENILTLRIDLAPTRGEGFTKEISLKSTSDFSFLIRRYSLPDLYTGKIAAVLSREHFEGKERVARFKGRDYFDIWWLHEKGIRWNQQYLTSLTHISSADKLVSLLNAKIQEGALRKAELKQDLLPFFENPAFVEDVINNLHTLTTTI
jgi:predicted nucleotidyltransferase component of viral defense system